MLEFNKRVAYLLSLLHNLCNKEVKIYLVGGFLRDYLLGKESKDLDFIINPFSYKILETFSKIIKGKIFPLDEERKYFRIVTNLEGDNYTLDFTPPLGRNLLEELKRRDFTINTLLLDVENFRILDPLMGMKDIREGKLRVCSEYSLSEDPLRILRAFRFWANLGFKITYDTERYILKNKSFLKRVKGERIHDEVYRILKSSFTREVWTKMHSLKVLEEIFPELSILENIPWSEPHHTNPLFHSFEALGILEFIYYYLSYLFPKGKEDIENYLKEEIYSEFTKRELLKLAILLHDIGKEKFFIDDKERVHYYGHENIGALMLENIGERLKLSKKEEELLKKLIRNHLYPFFIFKNKRAEKLKILNRLKEETVGGILLFLGDQLAINPIEDLISFSKEILDLYLEKKEIKILLSGEEIIEYFSLKSSPLIGKLKKELLKAQQEGLVRSKEEALKFLENILKSEGNRQKNS